MVLSMERWKGKVAVVTGASSGIGASICKKLVEEGLQVVGLARRKNLIEELAQELIDFEGKLFPLQADISKEEDILAAFDWIKSNLGPIHILVNNAGLAQPTNLTNGSTDMWKKVLDVNVLGLCIATREAIQDMTKNNVDGHIIHINSIAGHKVPNIPSFNIYPASKFAVTALTESLRVELNSMESKIKISSISPGAVGTEFVSQLELDDDSQLAKAFEFVLKPEDVADAVLYVLSTAPHVQIHELTIKPVNEPF
uniref:FOLD4 n=1 Tax=Colaphellus bowringi TaxID=561076 RepID=A0A8G0VKH0_9CUCU|nr:FOLD4 [Colaphellus bowringi]